MTTQRRFWFGKNAERYLFCSVHSFHSTSRAATLVASRRNQQVFFAALAATGAVGLSYSILSTDKVVTTDVNDSIGYVGTVADLVYYAS